MNDKTILLAQSYPGKVLTLRVLEKAGIKNQLVVTRDGVEALSYLFGTGDYEGQNIGSPLQRSETHSTVTV